MQTLARRRSRKGRRGPLRVPLADHRRRLRIVMVALAVVVSLCAGRLLQLQGFDSSAYAAISNGQLTRSLTVLPTRGEILDRDGEVLASSEPAVNVTADPSFTAANATEIAAVLDNYLDTGHDALMAALTKPDTRFVYLAKQVPASTYTKISNDLAERQLYGVFREKAPIRTYPQGTVAANLLGFVGNEGTGAAGLEYSLQSKLAGSAGKEVYESSPNGERIPLGTSIADPATNGATYTTTIDSELQWVTERRLAAQLKTSKAESGIAIVMNIKTGEVLAMANAPSFDPNDYGDAASDQLGNRAISDPYEPGSVEKVLTAAALIDTGIVTPSTHVEIPSEIESGGAMIHDYFEHGTLRYTMRGVIANSSNIGTVELTRTMNTKVLHRYLTNFGLGSKTGIELPGESTGQLPGADMPGYTRDRVAFGQAVSVTSIQMASAIAGILNGGVYNSPTVIKSATDANGNPIAVEHQAPRRIVKASTSKAVQELMQAVVYNAPQNLAMAQYNTGGKTGTAQRADDRKGAKNCGCYNSYTSSYVNYAPLDDPQILTYVVIAKPKAGNTGSANAAPVAKSVMAFALPRYGIKPSTTAVREKALTY